jgi:hypothetical protein
MDIARVKERAAGHLRDLQAARDAVAARQGRKPSEVLDEQFAAIRERLDQESRSYCDAYNAAIGHEKLTCENDDHGINVEAGDFGARLHLEPATRRVSRCVVESRDFSGTSFPVQVSQRGDELLLTLDAQPASEEAVVMLLLDELTAAVTEYECSQM